MQYVSADPYILTPQMAAYDSPSPCVVTESNYTDVYRGWKAFDQQGGQTNWWYDSTAAPQWIKFDFGVGNAVKANRYNMFTSNNNNLYPGMPTAWTLEGSDDDSSWTELDSVSGYIGWGATFGGGNFGASFFFNNSASYRYYRWTFTAKEAGASGWQICEIELIYKTSILGYVPDANKISPTMTAADAPSPYIVTEDDYTDPYAGWKVFDGLDSSPWNKDDLDASHWIKIDMNSACIVNGYSLTSNPNMTLYGGMPTSWTLYASNNDSDWTALDAKTSVDYWTNSEMRKYSFKNSSSYRYYKLEFGDKQAAGVQYFAWQIDEFELIYPFTARTGFWQVIMRLLDQQGR